MKLNRLNPLSSSFFEHFELDWAGCLRLRCVWIVCRPSQPQTQRKLLSSPAPLTQPQSLHQSHCRSGQCVCLSRLLTFWRFCWSFHPSFSSLCLRRDFLQTRGWSCGEVSGRPPGCTRETSTSYVYSPTFWRTKVAMKQRPRTRCPGWRGHRGNCRGWTASTRLVASGLWRATRTPTRAAAPDWCGQCGCPRLPAPWRCTCKWCPWVCVRWLWHCGAGWSRSCGPRTTHTSWFRGTSSAPSSPESTH